MVAWLDATDADFRAEVGRSLREAAPFLLAVGVGLYGVAQMWRVFALVSAIDSDQWRNSVRGA